MPWKVRKIRRFGPFSFESSRHRSESADLSAGRPHPGHQPLFGGQEPRVPSVPSRSDAPLFGHGRQGPPVADRPPADVVPLDGQRSLRVVPDPDVVELTGRPDPPDSPRATWGA